MKRNLFENIKYLLSVTNKKQKGFNLALVSCVITEALCPVILCYIPPVIINICTGQKIDRDIIIFLALIVLYCLVLCI